MNNEVVKNFIIKKFKLKEDIDKNKKIFSISDLLKLAKNLDFIRKSICHLSKNKQKQLIENANLNKIERFVYSTYYNFYSKKNFELSKNGEFKKKMTSNIVIAYLKTYFKYYRINKNTIKMINAMRHKAYYDFYHKKSK
jgi:hypothetical protein